MKKVALTYDSVNREDEKHEKYWKGFTSKILLEFAFHDDTVDESLYLDKVGLAGIKIFYSFKLPIFKDWTYVKEEFLNFQASKHGDSNIDSFIEWLQSKYSEGIKIYSVDSLQNLENNT
jgi:hypothetical protein